MMLSDTGIRRALLARHIAVTPLAPQDAIQPSSIDLRLGNELRIFTEGGDPIIDPERRQDDTVLKRIPTQGFIVEAGEFLLGTTEERVEVGPGHAMQFTGKSSLARLGLLVHATAGHIDPGFAGKITLEIMNLRDKPIRLRAGMWIGQVLVFQLDQACDRPYGSEGLSSRYQDQSTVTESRSWL